LACPSPLQGSAHYCELGQDGIFHTNSSGDDGSWESAYWNIYTNYKDTYEKYEQLVAAVAEAEYYDAEDEESEHEAYYECAEGDGVYYEEYNEETGEWEAYEYFGEDNPQGDDDEEDEEIYYNKIYEVDAEECDSAADEEECAVYMQRRKAHRARLRGQDPRRKFPRYRKKGRFPRFRCGRGKGKGKGRRRRAGKGGKGFGRGPNMGRPLFNRSPGGKGKGYRRRRYSLLAEHEFPGEMAEALEEVYFQKTGRRRRPKGFGKGGKPGPNFDDMMKGSKGKGKGFGFGSGKGKFGR